MNKNIISKVFDDVLLKNQYTIKCSPSNSPSVKRAFQEYGEKHNLKFIKPDNSGSAFTLYDDKHDTYLDFSKRFVNKNFIDIKNKGEKTINLEDLFKGYDNLPDKNKDRVNLIKFHHVDEKDVGDGTLAFARFLDSDAGETNTITMPDYFFTKYMNNTYDNYDAVLAHESMHCYDYPRLKGKTLDIVKGILKDGSYTNYKDLQTFVKVQNRTGKQKFTKTYGVFDKAKTSNESYLSDNHAKVSANKSSDYGASKVSEDFAEAGRMVIMGHNNPDNPKATILYNGREMQYREWVTIHPYQTQALLKELYNEKVSIDDVLKDGVSTPIVPTS